MVEIEKPRIECIDSQDDVSYGKYIVEPLERGYGTTLGNSLRRILLSSLPGTAATSIKIAGVQHEFSTVPGVKEDVTEIVLNVKKIIAKLHCQGTKTVYIDAAGECEVTAGDIKADGEVEILNPEQHICSLGPDASFNMEITLSHGRGYVPSDKNKTPNMPIGTIAVDSIYTPVYKVNYTVENTRVGNMTDYDKLTLEVWTDSTISARDAVSLGAKILSIVNVVGSSIARESDDVLYTWAGPEIAVATTKAYSTQLVLLDMLGVYFAKVCGSIGDAEYEEIVEELLALPVKMEAVLEDIDEIKYLASRYFNHNSIFFIGRNLDYALGLEGSLKLKEISYIHSEAYASGELKHGTISLIEDGTLVVALGTYKPLFEKTLSNIIEVKARGADIVALTAESKAADMRKTAENVLSVPDTHVILQPSLGVIPLQLFAYYVALHKGCDIDKPRNLAKSVTVE